MASTYNYDLGQPDTTSDWADHLLVEAEARAEEFLLKRRARIALLRAAVLAGEITVDPELKFLLQQASR